MLTYGYMRVSTDKQDLSLQAQETHLESAAQLHVQAAIDEFFSDPDTSGSTPFASREGGARLLTTVAQAVAAGDQVTILVPKLDRMGRNTIDVLETVKRIDALGDPGDRTRVIFLDLNVDSRTPVGRLIITVIAACAEMELARIRERIANAFEVKRSKRQVIGTVPYGWDERILPGQFTKSGKPLRELVDNPTEQARLIWIARQRVAGWSWRHIAQQMNADGVPTKRQGERLNIGHAKTAAVLKTVAGQWTSAQVSKVLKSKSAQALLAGVAVEPGDSEQSSVTSNQ